MKTTPSRNPTPSPSSWPIVDTGVRGKPVGVTLEQDSQIAGTSATLTLLPITPVLQLV
jgi:hypothetical protein